MNGIWNHCCIYQRDLHLSSTEVFFCYFLRFLRHFCTRDKYWRVVGYRSARYLSLGKTVVSHLKKLYIKRQKFDIVDWHCDVIIEVAIWLLHLKLRKNLTRYIELFFCQNEAFWWKFCLNAIKLLEVVSVKKTIKKEFQQFNCFIAIFGQTLGVFAPEYDGHSLKKF